MTPQRRAKLQVVIDNLREEFSRMVAEFTTNNPTMTMSQIADVFGISESLVSLHCKKHGVKRLRGKGSTAAQQKEENEDA